MKRITFILVLAPLLAAGLSAAEQRIKLTPQTLTGWKANGTDLSLLADQGELTVLTTRS